MKNLRNLLVLAFFVFGVTAIFLPTRVAAQRDYFTDEEIELIRDAQEIDRRMDVLTHAIDRRFAALKVDVGGPKISTKESEKWGELPKGTHLELLLDIKRILQKAIDDIDSLSERPDSAILPDPDDKSRKNKSFKDLFPAAVKSLAAAAKRYQPALKTELDNTKDPAEKGSLLDSLESCEEIIASVAKLPAEEPKPAGKKH
ncbi:hypothetical protein BH10ACI2_BH10ACI2_19710 [soil metagenome]